MGKLWDAIKKGVKWGWLYYNDLDDDQKKQINDAIEDIAKKIIK